MNSMPFTKTELLLTTGQVYPLAFSEGDRVTFSDISLSISAKSSCQEIIKELGITLQQQNVYLSTISPEKIRVKKVAPLSFRVLEPFELHYANRTNWLTPPFNHFGFRNITTIHNVDIISRGDGAIRPLLLEPYHEELEKDILSKS